MLLEPCIMINLKCLVIIKNMLNAFSFTDKHAIQNSEINCLRTVQLFWIKRKLSHLTRLNMDYVCQSNLGFPPSGYNPMQSSLLQHILIETLHSQDFWKASLKTVPYRWSESQEVIMNGSLLSCVSSSQHKVYWGKDFGEKVAEKYWEVADPFRFIFLWLYSMD